MLDWVTGVFPCTHIPLPTGSVVSVDADGVVEWETVKRLTVRGSHESTMRVRSVGSNGAGKATKEFFIMDILKTAATLSLVSAFVISTPYYIQYIVPFVLGAGDDISAAITGSPPSATVLDSMMNNTNSSIIKMLDSMQFGITDDWGIGLKTLFAVGLTYVGSFVFIFYATAYLLVAKFMVGLLLSVGTLFICFSFFPVTRGMFQSWIGQCLNYIMLNIFYTVAIGMMNSFIISKFDLENLGLESSFQIIIIFFISVFIIQQIGSLSSSLTGGVGINGLTSAANTAAKTLRDSSKAMAKSSFNSARNFAVNGLKGA